MVRARRATLMTARGATTTKVTAKASTMAKVASLVRPHPTTGANKRRTCLLRKRAPMVKAMEHRQQKHMEKVAKLAIGTAREERKRVEAVIRAVSIGTDIFDVVYQLCC